ncbi:MAG TPA: hypothetical protein VGX21_21700 [Methylomirabilota bacterium]|nr:hypothetical protein [Methylomirabilota bacterium]
MTLPDDVVRWLTAIHVDPAWAVVSLFEQATRRPSRRNAAMRPQPQLAHLGGRRALIVVDPGSCRNLSGVSVIPMAADRAFLALDGQRGLADLELTILDRLDDPRTDPAERRELNGLRRQLREWRRSPRLRFSTRSIILVEGVGREIGTTRGRVKRPRRLRGRPRHHRRRPARGPKRR